MPAGMFQGQGSNSQASAIGISSLQFGPESPVMSRMEAGETGGERTTGVPGVTGQTSPGAAMQGSATSDWNNTCPELSWISWEPSW